MTKRNIIAGWAASGLFPFNPERVLRCTPKPSAELSVTQANVVSGSYPQDENSHMPVTPVTPVTPSTTEALTSLHNLIKQEACSLDGQNKQRLQRHTQKLASAAKRSFTEETLLQEQTRFLSKMNNEAKAPRSARSIVLGKAKVVSYEDLEEARTRRATKENLHTIAAKGKRGRGRKNLALDAKPAIRMAKSDEMPEPVMAPAVP